MKIGWLTLPVLLRMRASEITFVYGPFCRMNQREIGQQWGEGEWTARDLWSKA